MENINIIDGSGEVFEHPDDIVKKIIHDEKLIGVIPFTGGNYRFLKDKIYQNKANLSKNRLYAGYFLLLFFAAAGIAAYFLSKYFETNLIFVLTVIPGLLIVILYFYIINRFYKNINALAITASKIYFFSIKEIVPFIRFKKGFMLVFYSMIKETEHYNHYCTRCSELLQFKGDGAIQFIATIDMDEMKHRSHFKSTLLPIDKLSAL